MSKIFKVVLISIAIILGAMIMVYYWTIAMLRPEYEGTVKSSRLDTKVEVLFDDFGVPYVSADNLTDAYYVIGYLHAKERLWQMTLSQLSIEGRFAEFLGEDALPYDRFLRTINFKELARKNEALLDDEQKALLNAYSNGVNDWVEQNRTRLPIEFALVEMEPLSWQPWHSLGVARLMAWQLNVMWWAEVAYAKMAEKLAPEVFRDIAPENWPNEPGSTPLSQVSDLVKTDQKWRRLLNFEGSSVGSNAWAISGSRTKSGKPMLAGDPHLGMGMPPVWYELQMHTPELSISGVTLPGIPTVVLGQNDSLAWSFTNVMADDADFFQEIIHPRDSMLYLKEIRGKDSVWAELQIHREYISTKDGKSVAFTRKQTQNGVLIQDIHPKKDVLKDNYLALSWTAFEASNELRALLKMNSAKNMEEVREAAKNFSAPSQNFVFATKKGDIGRFTAGRIPLRNKNLPIVLEGWNPDHRWNGYIPFEELPHQINPGKGWVASANTKIHDEAYPYYISRYWEPRSRQNRIESYLDTLNKVTISDFARIQNDVFSDHAYRLISAVLPILQEADGDEDVKLVLSYLRNWDYRYSTLSTAASITDVFFQFFTRNTLKDELGESVFESFVHLENIPVRTMHKLLELPEHPLFDDTGTEMVEQIDVIVLRSLKEAIAHLKKEFGDEPYKWRWEELHSITFAPPIFKEAASSEEAPGALKLMVSNVLGRGPYPKSGHGMSVNNAQYDWNSDFSMILGPSVRRIVDLGNADFSLSVLPTGQSGNPLSSHFDDQIRMWLEGEYKPIYYGKAELKKNRSTTELIFVAE